MRSVSGKLGLWVGLLLDRSAGSVGCCTMTEPRAQFENRHHHHHPRRYPSRCQPQSAAHPGEPCCCQRHRLAEVDEAFQSCRFLNRPLPTPAL